MSSQPVPGPVASVVIPAHNEAAVIGRCLDALARGATPGEFQVVVVSNGSTDRTAAIARAHPLGVHVVETDVPSKVVALNLGDAAVEVFPRAYLDADVEMDAASLRAAIDVLDDRVLCSAPPMELDLTGVPWFVRSFYRAFGDLPYLADDLVGNGVYVLAEQGRARFDRFPELTADDLFVRNLFAPSERRSSPTGRFVVHPPRTLAGLIAIRQRGYRGNAEYAASGLGSAAESTFSPRRLLAGWVRHPVDMTTFIVINVAAKLKLRFASGGHRWERDESSRA